MASTVHAFEVEMTCEGCSGAIDKILGRLKGSTVDDFTVSLPDKKVTVTSKLSADELLAIIKKAGKTTTYLGSV